jgi:hypothetical protein
MRRKEDLQDKIEGNTKGIRRHSTERMRDQEREKQEGEPRRRQNALQISEADYTRDSVCITMRDAIKKRRIRSKEKEAKQRRRRRTREVGKSGFIQQ